MEKKGHHGHHGKSHTHHGGHGERFPRLMGKGEPRQQMPGDDSKNTCSKMEWKGSHYK